MKHFDYSMDTKYYSKSTSCGSIILKQVIRPDISWHQCKSLLVFRIVLDLSCCMLLSIFCVGAFYPPHKQCLWMLFWTLVFTTRTHVDGLRWKVPPTLGREGHKQCCFACAMHLATMAHRYWCFIYITHVHKPRWRASDKGHHHEFHFGTPYWLAMLKGSSFNLRFEGQSSQVVWGNPRTQPVNMGI